MLKFGDNNIGKVFLGSNSIGKAYYGSNLVYQKGDIPPRPVFYDRLVFDGTAYIDTDITPPTDASLLVRLGNETTKAAQRVFIAPTANGGIGMNYGNGTTSNNRYFNIYYGQSSLVSSDKYLNFSTSMYNFFLTPNRFGWGSTASYTITRGAENASGAITIGSNQTHSGQPFTGSMQTFHIYGSDAQNATKAADFENYTPAYTLRPCTYDGEAGLWCVETSTFYGNTAGAGSLSVSND